MAVQYASIFAEKHGARFLWMCGYGTLVRCFRRVARIWERGGYFERVRSVKTTLTRIFIDLESVSDGLSETWGEMSRKARKFKAFFRPKLGDLQKKKKKGLRQNSEWFFGRNPKFKGFFRPKLGDLKKKKKKKGSSPKLRLLFRPISQIQTFEGGLFSNGGGAIFHFSHKIGLKSTKSMRFCILHKPMGSSPPRPPLATLLRCLKFEHSH